MNFMKHSYLIALLSFTALFLSSCLYDAPPSQPASQIDTWLLGQWITQDKSGKIFEAVVTPTDNTHYHVTFCDKDKEGVHPWEFDAWISRVGDIKFLTLQSLSPDPRYHNRYLFLHYELMKPEKAPLDGVGARRMRLSEPQLPASAQQLDSYHLRQVMSKRLDQGTLLLPSTTSLGFSVWTRTGSVNLPGKQI